MYDKKRQVRECTNEVTVYDTIEHTYKLIKTKGMNVIPRKDHVAAVYGHSMIVFGGQHENGTITGDMLNLDLQHFDWGKIHYKQNVEPFYNAACVSVRNIH